MGMAGMCCSCNQGHRVEAGVQACRQMQGEAYGGSRPNFALEPGQALSGTMGPNHTQLTYSSKHSWPVLAKWCLEATREGLGESAADPYEAFSTKRWAAISPQDVRTACIYLVQNESSKVSSPNMRL